MTMQVGEPIIGYKKGPVEEAVAKLAAGKPL